MNPYREKPENVRDAGQRDDAQTCAFALPFEDLLHFILTRVLFLPEYASSRTLHEPSR